MHYLSGEDRSREVSFVLDEVIAEDHYVRLIEILTQQYCQQHIDLFTSKGNKPRGRKAYSPVSLLSLLLYGYLNGISSSRKLEQESYRNVELMWLLRSLKPDHKTIADFRKDNGVAIESFLKNFNKMLKSQGYISGDSVSIDGSKIRAYASKSYDINTIKAKLEKLSGAHADYLKALEQIDVKEDELEQITQQRDLLLEKVEKLEKKQQELSALQAIDTGSAARISPTDPEARQMKGRCGKHFSYNFQAATDTAFDMISCALVSNVQNDKGLLSTVVEELHHRQGHYPDEALADAGYYVSAQIEELQEQKGVDCYVAINDNKKQKIEKEHDIHFSYDEQKDEYLCSEGKTLVKVAGIKRDNARGTQQYVYRGTACGGCAKKSLCTKASQRHIYRHLNQGWHDSYRAKMESAKGKQKRRQRASTVEHPFGTLKLRMGHTPLLLRGIKKVTTEMCLYVFGYNFTRLLNLADFKSIKGYIQQPGLKNGGSIPALSAAGWQSFVLNLLRNRLILDY